MLGNALASKGISKEFEEWVAIAMDRPKWRLELELVQSQMTQKPMPRAEVYAHAMHASQNLPRFSSGVTLVSHRGGRSCGLPMAKSTFVASFSQPARSCTSGDSRLTPNQILLMPDG